MEYDIYISLLLNGTTFNIKLIVLRAVIKNL